MSSPSLSESTPPRIVCPLEKLPAELAKVSERAFQQFYSWFEGREFETVLIIARGSNDNVATFLRYLIEVYLEVPVVLAAPSVWVRYSRNPRFYHCLAIGITYSGDDQDVAEVLTRMRSSGHQTLAITNCESAEIARSCEYQFNLNLESSEIGAAAFAGLMLTAYELVRSLGGALGAPILPDEKWVNECVEAAAQDAKKVAMSDYVVVLGRGMTYASAQETAHQLSRIARIGARGFSTADFVQDQIGHITSKSVIVAYEKLDDAVVRTGATVIYAPVCPLDESLYAIWCAIYGERLAREVAAQLGR